ncbi:conserved repeat domain-containing protein [Abditibacterium utsteinense]|uniref:Conserved repeat domain-containing protein n=1 Tax=Abditibacterium utsteinense TaxID=1960156 RepID=A0A2S8SQ18_9BACT|nr:S-layer homology domain-containing protein [Abditibacterium utsteinense]PQV62891.1 conserved repeat domain-containing protein [Abditibacterium utsteinense]
MKTKNFWPQVLGTTLSATFGAASILAAGSLAHAQSSRAGSKQPRLVMAAGDVVKMAVGERIVLPYANVTRIITDDDDIARAFFQSGNAVLEGSAPGSTTVEIYQTNGTPKVLTIQVGNAVSLPNALPGRTETPLSPAPVPLPESGAITPSQSPLTLSLGVSPAPGNASQALYTLTYGNPGPNPVQNAVVRFPLSEKVSLVTGSASNGGRYDASQREVTWNLGIVSAGLVDQKLTFRVEPIERTPTTFAGIASIEDGSGGTVQSNQVQYSTSTTPLLTVFALPDRFLASKNGPILGDVKGIESQTAVDRLVNLGVLSGRPGNLFYPAAPTQRAEYAVMTLNGLNLRDLRDITQIKFVLGRRSIVNLTIQNAAGKNVVGLIRNTTFDAGENTAIWNGRVGAGFAAPGRYTYVCSAKDARGQITTLKGTLNIVPQTPLNPTGVPSFIDVKPSDWFARYLAVGEKQGLFLGFPDKTFRPTTAISRIEATAIVVRALGLEDLAKEWSNKDVGFLDYQNTPKWGRGYQNVATTVAKTAAARPMMKGTPSNFYEPLRDLRRDEAALIVQRLIDRETTRRITVSGAMVPGATVTINSRSVEADDQGQFAFSIDSSNAVPTTVAVIDARDR